MAFVREQLGLNPLLVLHYLEREEKKSLESEYPMVDFDRAVVAIVTVKGVAKVREMRRFLCEFAELEVGPGTTKNVCPPFIEEEQGEAGSDFWVIFVHQVGGGPLSITNIGYLTGLEVDMWERAAGRHMHHYAGGVTVIKG